jgi:hypothetical protein
MHNMPQAELNVMSSDSESERNERAEPEDDAAESDGTGAQQPIIALDDYAAIPQASFCVRTKGRAAREEPGALYETSAGVVVAPAVGLDKEAVAAGWCGGQAAWTLLRLDSTARKQNTPRACRAYIVVLCVAFARMRLFVGKSAAQLAACIQQQGTYAYSRSILHVPRGFGLTSTCSLEHFSSLSYPLPLLLQATSKAVPQPGERLDCPSFEWQLYLKDKRPMLELKVGQK